MPAWDGLGWLVSCSLDGLVLLFPIEDTHSVDVNSVDDPDDHRVDRHVLGFWRQSCGRALSDQDIVANTRPKRVDCYKCSSCRDQALTRLGVQSIRLHDHELLTDHRIDLLRRHKRAGNFRDEHRLTFQQLFSLASHYELFVGGQNPNGNPRIRRLKLCFAFC